MQAGPDGFFRPCSRHRVRPSYGDFLNSFAMKARAEPYGSYDKRNSRTGLSSYRSHVNDNKSKTGSRNIKPVCFWFSDIFIWQNMSFRPETRHQAFRPGSCKQLQKFHTGLSSYRSEFVPVSCKYALTNFNEVKKEAQ